LLHRHGVPVATFPANLPGIFQAKTTCTGSAAISSCPEDMIGASHRQTDNLRMRDFERRLPGAYLPGLPQNPANTA
jgi:hypothetical protein